MTSGDSKMVDNDENSAVGDEKLEVERRRSIIAALWFVPIIAGLLVFALLAAFATEAQSQREGSEATPVVVSEGTPKRIYGGVYRDLTFPRKLKWKLGAYGPYSAQLSAAAIAYEFPTNEILAGARDAHTIHLLGELILDGRVAFAMREGDTLNLVPSPEVLHVWWADVSDAANTPTLTSLNEADVDDVLEHWETLIAADADASIDPPAMVAWESNWRRYMEHLGVSVELDDDGISSVSDAFISAENLGDLVTLSATETILGHQPRGRVITWKGEQRIPILVDAIGLQ